MVELADPLEACAIPVKKLGSMPDVSIQAGAQTTEITGADGRVNGQV